MTRWTLVSALNSDSTISAQQALAELCQAYWYPLYVYVRCRGSSAEDAEDMTQAFFQAIIAKKSLSAAAREKGKLRSFLLGALKNFMVDEYRKQNRQKRGGGLQVLSIDQELAENRYQNEPVDSLTPESIFDRRWAMTILDRVQGDLQKEYDERGKSHHFAVLGEYIAWNDTSRPQEEAARELEMSEPAFRSAVVRVRKKYRKLLRLHVADTVSCEEEVDQELTELMETLRSA